MSEPLHNMWGFGDELVGRSDANLMHEMRMAHDAIERARKDREEITKQINRLTYTTRCIEREMMLRAIERDRDQGLIVFSDKMLLCTRLLRSYEMLLGIPTYHHVNFTSEGAEVVWRTGETHHSIVIRKDGSVDNRNLNFLIDDPRTWREKLMPPVQA